MLPSVGDALVVHERSKVTSLISPPDCPRAWENGRADVEWGPLTSTRSPGWVSMMCLGKISVAPIYVIRCVSDGDGEEAVTRISNQGSKLGLLYTPEVELKLNASF